MTENQEEKKTSLKYFYERVLESFEYNTNEYYAITDALNEAKEKYEEEISTAYLEGFNDGSFGVTKNQEKYLK
jgi:hypothetical protein